MITRNTQIFVCILTGFSSQTNCLSLQRTYSKKTDSLHLSRRSALTTFVGSTFGFIVTPTPAFGTLDAPSEEATMAARKAFAAFETRNLPEAETQFSTAIAAWRQLDAGIYPTKRAELNDLLIARARVCVDSKRFVPALADLDEAIGSMALDGKRPDGRAAYFEFADAYVQRGLAHEGLAGRPEQRPAEISADSEWQRAVEDYDEALSLWGPGGKGTGVGIGPNPFVLTYRGNARAALSDYNGALSDFRASEGLFAEVAKKDATAGYRRIDALANEALALYALGRTEEAARIARTVVAKRPGLTDMRALLAAELWERGEVEAAESQWFDACSDVSSPSGCGKYTDADWLRSVRRWPPSLVEAQMRFLKRVPPLRG